MVNRRLHTLLAIAQVFAASLSVYLTNQRAVMAWVTFNPAHVPSRFPSSKKRIITPRSGAPESRVSMSYTPKDIQAAWNNHFTSFGAKDVSVDLQKAVALFFHVTACGVGIKPLLTCAASRLLLFASSPP